MNLKIFVFIFTILSIAAFAEDSKHELEIEPLAAYATSVGFGYGIDASYYYRLSEKLQLGVGGHYMTMSGDKWEAAKLDLIYNFSEEFKSSYFAGLGAIYSKTYYTVGDEYALLPTFTLGKRFAPFENQSITYKPYIKVFGRSDRDYSMYVMPLNFSWLF